MIEILNKNLFRASKTVIAMTAGIGLMGCNHTGTTTHTGSLVADLPSTLTLGTVRGKHFERVITHFHSPFSFDACDGNGMKNGTPNRQCAQGIEEAICSNKINYIFASDHAPYMADATFENLLLIKDGAQEVLFATRGLAKKKPVAKIVRCANGHQGFFSPGVEGRLLGLGMTRHIPGTLEHRYAIYTDDTLRSSQTLRKEAEAIIVIPHTESRSLQTIERAQPDAMEIYNFHANFDPLIRYKHLSAPPIQHLFSFLDYIFDAYHVLNPDYLFLEFVQFFPVYFEKWNQMIARGFTLTGLGGTDAHQNVIAQTMVDGERLDSYRRMTRFMTHFVLVESPPIALDLFQNYLNTKAALKKGRVYFVLEGLGTPVGFDFFAETIKTGAAFDQRLEMGEKIKHTLKPTLHFKIPKVLQDSPGIREYGQPMVKAEMIHIDAKGNETIVAARSIAAGFSRDESQEIIYPNPQPGAYRVKVSLIPSHLRGIVRRGDYTGREYVWMITNHLYVTD